MSATIRTGPTFAIAACDTLFADQYMHATNPHAIYDVMPDGSFIFLHAASEGNMVVVTNWKSVLRSRLTQAGAK